MMALDLDVEATTWLWMSLRDEIARMRERNGTQPPESIVELLQMCETRLNRVRKGQAGSTLAELRRTLDARSVSPLLVVLDEVAEVLGGLSASSVKRLVNRGDLPTVQIGGRVFVRESDLQAYVQNLSVRRKAA